jgi:hypothetical protein
MLSGAYRRGPISSMQCQSRMLEMRGSAQVLVLQEVCIPFGDARRVSIGTEDSMRHGLYG